MNRVITMFLYALAILLLIVSVYKDRDKTKGEYKRAFG